MARDKHILVVEDDSLLRDELSKALLKGGYTISVARNGEEALEVIRGEQTFDLILLDVLMPGMGGLEMLKQLTKDDLASKVPIIILSNIKEDTAIAEAVATGGYDYLLKADWTLDDVLEKVGEKLAR